MLQIQTHCLAGIKMPFTFKKLAIPEVILIKPKVFADGRGFFMESYQKSLFVENGMPENFVQDNLSHSAKGVLRGLHYQKDPQAQGKLVMVISGEIFDVAVDIRRGSPTFGKWVGDYLSDKNKNMLYIPPGFAHGFCVLSEEVDFTYKVTAEYAPQLDRGILWNDAAIGIEWPVFEALLSDKDTNQPLLKDADINYVYKAS